MTLLLDDPIVAPSARATPPLLHNDSLGRTIDAVGEEFFYSRPIARATRERIAQWIASRPAGYAGMPAPTGHDFCEGVLLFTGEMITSRAGTGHILGEEACRTLRFLDVHTPLVRRTLARADDAMLAKLRESKDQGSAAGFYCCGRCSAALWRNAAAGGLAGAADLVAHAMRTLRRRRDRGGRWRAFPFFYTVLALTEICHPLAEEELRHAAPLLERLLKSPPRLGKHAQRRRDLAERALTIC